MKSMRCSLLLACAVIWNSSVGAAVTHRALWIKSDGEYVELPAAPALRLPEAFTLEAWVKFDMTTISPAFLSLRRGDGSRGVFLGLLTPAFFIQIVDESGQLNGFGATAPPYPNVWHHVAATYDGFFLSLYVNGVRWAKGGMQLAPDLFTTPNSWLIGREGVTNQAGTLFGQIDEVRIWNRALTTTEIQANVKLKLRGNEPGLIGFWTFDNGDASDSSPYANHGILRGDPEIVPSTLELVQAPLLKIGRVVTDQAIELIIDCSGPVDCVIERSADLSDWQEIGRVPGINGVVSFIVPIVQSQGQFFRARLSP